MTFPEMWTISALGLPDLQERWPKDLSTFNASIITQLYNDSGGVIPTE